jgi:RNA polymerase sigma-70 factor (ECF subfamily)
VGVLDHPGAWVRRVAVNLAMSRFRRLAAEARALRRYVGGSPTAFPAPEPDGDRFWEAVRHLPRRQAQAVALHYLEDRSVAEIAETLSIAEGAVKAALFKGRRNLEKALDVERGGER